MNGNLIYNAWVTGFKGRIDSYGPPPLEKMTQLFFEMNTYDINIRIPDEGRPPLAPMVIPHEITKPGKVMEDENVKVTAALVITHRLSQHSLSDLTHQTDQSLYQATTPSDNLVKLARGADILIHEVIHKQSLAKLMSRILNADRLLEHIVASHTTVEDVGKVAKAAGVKTLALTHFVPADDQSVTDEMWRGPAKASFDGE